MAAMQPCVTRVTSFMKYLFRKSPWTPVVEVFFDPQEACVKVIFDFKFSRLIYTINEFDVWRVEVSLADIVGILPQTIPALFSKSSLIIPEKFLFNPREGLLTQPTGNVPMMVVGGYHHGSVMNCDVDGGRVVAVEGDIPAFPIPSSVKSFNPPKDSESLTAVYFAHTFRVVDGPLTSFVLSPSPEAPNVPLIHATVEDYPELSILPSVLLFSHRMFSCVKLVHGAVETKLNKKWLGDF